MLTHLNTILKATLSSSTPEKIPLSQELQTVDHYLAIEQARFADRLRVEMKIDAGALDGLVLVFYCSLLWRMPSAMASPSANGMASFRLLLQGTALNFD